MAEPSTVKAEHPDHLQHHFVSSEQQFDAAKMGMWLFLVTEILLFSGMFVAYAVFRIWYPEVFSHSAELLDWRLGGLNTIVLLASSFTVALGVHYAQTNERRKLVRALVLTILFAGAFMVVKYFEYTGKFAHGVFPGVNFDPHGVAGGHDYADYNIPFAAQFFSIYFEIGRAHV